MENGTEKTDFGIRSVGKALEILNCVSEYADGASVGKIAERLSINKATVSKMLSTMAAYNCVRKDEETRRYHLGYRLVELSSRLIESIDIRTEARPFLKNLERRINEVINLAIYRNGEVVYIDKFEGTKSLRMHSRIGGRASFAYTSVGKAVLAFLPDSEREYLLENMVLEPRTRHSIVDRGVFLKQLGDTRAKGYALDLEENEEGIVCVGAPVFDFSRRVVAAVSISCPTVRTGMERLLSLGGDLLETCGRISAACGCPSELKIPTEFDQGRSPEMRSIDS